MTNEEAIKKITHVKYCYAYEGDYEAFDMAIKALSADRPKNMIHIDDAYRLIAGHSDYHGDSILSAFTCLVEGKDVKSIAPLDESADRRTGKWIRCKKQNKADLYNGNALYECSNCGHTDLHAETQEVPYCWYCGARMKGEEE